MMRFIIFTRVSTKKQDIENQKHECIQYVERNKSEGDEVYFFDEPETSSRVPIAKRPVLNEMLKFFKRGDTLVIYKLDRLARDGLELVSIYRNLLDECGINLVSIYESNIDKSIIHIYAFGGEKERENIRIRTISCLKAKQARFEKVGTEWYGYHTDPDILQTFKPDAHSYGKPYLLIPKKSEQEQLEIMLDLHRKGLSYGEIAKELKEKGYRNRKGNPVQKMTIYRVLKRLKGENQPQQYQAVI